MSEVWVEKYLHPEGIACPRCGRAKEEAWDEGKTKRSQLTKRRCKGCRYKYTAYYGTVFFNKMVTPAQVIMLLRGMVKGESTNGLARELGLKFDTVHGLRKALQKNAEQMQSQEALADPITETDATFQNAGEKREKAHAIRRPATSTSEQKTRTWHV